LIALITLQQYYTGGGELQGCQSRSVLPEGYGGRDKVGGGKGLLESAKYVVCDAHDMLLVASVWMPKGQCQRRQNINKDVHSVEARWTS
jgi:hypothetical protein